MRALGLTPRFLPVPEVCVSYLEAAARFWCQLNDLEVPAGNPGVVTSADRRGWPYAVDGDGPGLSPCCDAEGVLCALCNGCMCALCYGGFASTPGMLRCNCDVPIPELPSEDESDDEDVPPLVPADALDAAPWRPYTPCAICGMGPCECGSGAWCSASLRVRGGGRCTGVTRAPPPSSSAAAPACRDRSLGVHRPPASPPDGAGAATRVASATRGAQCHLGYAQGIGKASLFVPMPMRGGARSTRLRPRRTSPWWQKFTRRTWRLAARPLRRRSRHQLSLTRSVGAQCKPQPFDGSPPQQQRTRLQLDRREATEVQRSLFASPPAPADQRRVDELQHRVDELERIIMSMHAREADLLRRLAFYNPDKWTRLAAEARM